MKKSLTIKSNNYPPGITYLVMASVILLFTFLGAKDLWTQEHRWADIVTGMFYRQDFFHPYLGEVKYYDKPLLSYWLMALLSWIGQGVSTWALRIPSALAGILSVWSIYKIGSKQDKKIGLYAAWMLLTSYYFVFWARTSSADMLNLGGSLYAIAWYLDHDKNTDFLSYTIFFCILSLTSLCKGLVGFIVPLIAIFPYLLLTKSFKKHLNVTLFLSLLPALLIYVLPFLASSYFDHTTYGENGLYLVYKENVLRYFQPFDHKGPIYTYFIFLPVYLFPWTLLIIPAFINLKNRAMNLSIESRWYVSALLLLFLFFSLSGSRRNYYVLPIVPFALLIIADWTCFVTKKINRISILVLSMICLSYIGLFLWFGILQPLFYIENGNQVFATQVKKEAEKKLKWQHWSFVMLDPETKVAFYLNLPPNIKIYDINGDRKKITLSDLKQAWPITQHLNQHTIFISRMLYKPYLQKLLIGYQIVENERSYKTKSFHFNNDNQPIAFIPTETRNVGKFTH